MGRFDRTASNKESSESEHENSFNDRLNKFDVSIELDVMASDSDDENKLNNPHENDKLKANSFEDREPAEITRTIQNHGNNKNDDGRYR